jgi:D-methionine transport system substrate-binding protein
MQDLGWITLAENVGMTAIMEDIEVNDKNLQFTEYTQDTLSDVMKECDYCIAGADTAIINGLDVEDDAIRTETKNSASAGVYATLLVATQDKAEDVKLKTLADVLASDAMKEYVSDTYKGALDLMR